MASQDRNSIGIITGQVGIYEDEEIGDGFGEREGAGEGGPGIRVCIKDDSQQRGGGLWGSISEDRLQQANLDAIPFERPS